MDNIFESNNLTRKRYTSPVFDVIDCPYDVLMTSGTNSDLSVDDGNDILPPGWM